MGICLDDAESDCLTTLRFAEHVLLFSTSLEQLERMMCEFKQCTEKVGLKIHPEKTKILNNQRSNRRRKVAINNIKVEMLTTEECAKYLGQTITFQQQETTEIKKSNQGRLGVVLQIPARVDIKIIPPTTQTSLIQHGDHTDDELRFWHMGSVEHEKVIQSTQRKMLKPHCPTKKKIQKEDTEKHTEE